VAVAEFVFVAPSLSDAVIVKVFEPSPNALGVEVVVFKVTENVPLPQALVPVLVFVPSLIATETFPVIPDPASEQVPETTYAVLFPE